MTPPPGEREDAQRTDELRGQSAPAVFLEKRSYRRRRLMDASKLLPILGSLVFLVPLLWLVGGENADPVPTSQVVVFIFASWAGLIAINAVFGFAVGRWAEDWGRTDPSDVMEPDADEDPDR